jgi:chromosome segregation ATPase
MSQDANKFKEAFKRVKQIFDALKNDPDPALQGQDLTLQDGSAIRITGALQIGSAVKMLTPDGKTVNAPDGDMTLEDGTVITVKDGLITAIQSVGDQDDAASSDNDSTSDSYSDADVEEMRSQLAAHDKRISQLESKLNSATTALKAQSRKLTDSEARFGLSMELNEKFLSIVEELAKKPSASPTERKAHAFQSENKSRKQDEAIQNLSAAFHQLRNNKRY